MPSPPSADTSVYVHFPWCLRRCPYCDFAVRRADREDIPQERYRDAVLRELERRAPSLEGRRLVSIFIGGGTPSLLDPSSLASLLSAIHGVFDERAEHVEISSECNPSSLGIETIDGFIEAGINRFSVGVQSLEPEVLRFFERLHDPDGARDAVRAVSSRGVRLSADLIFGAPSQTPASLERDLRELVSAGVKHVSAYSLTIEPRTRFGELFKKGRLVIATDDTYAELYLRAEAVMGELGFDHYEVSNYATKSERSLHNAHYWKPGDYVGLGPSAVGALVDERGQGRRYRNMSDPMAYMESPTEESEELLDPVMLNQEALMLGLRTQDGVDLERAELRSGLAMHVGRQPAIDRALKEGSLVIEAGRMCVPQERWLSLDSIITRLF